MKHEILDNEAIYTVKRISNDFNERYGAESNCIRQIH